MKTGGADDDVDARTWRLEHGPVCFRERFYSRRRRVHHPAVTAVPPHRRRCLIRARRSRCLPDDASEPSVFFP